MKQIIIVLFILAQLSVALGKDSLCPGIVLHSAKDIDLTAVEKRMVCGDPKVEAYSFIPPYQAEFFITGFLQSRGYLMPKFEMINQVLHVYPGEEIKIREIHVQTGEEKERGHIKDEVLRKYRKKILTPKTLDAMEKDGLGVVRSRGFPCAEVKAEAIADEKSVTLDFDKLVHHDFGHIEREDIEGLHRNALDRFYPFEPEDSFDARLLQLTEKRMLRNNVVSGTYFMEKCSPDAQEFSISQNFILGPPRTIRYGVGANTEVGPFARLRWSNNRFGNMASQLSATLQASFRVQSLNLSSDMFLWEKRPRQSVFSQFEIVRESQFDYLQTLARVRPHMKWTADELRRFWSYTIGPTFEAGSYESEENDATRSYKTTALEGSLNWMSHAYEYFDIHPQEGDVFGINFDLRDPKLGFDHSLLKLDSTFAKLTQVGVWERGNVVAGMRLMAGTTFVPSEVSLTSLPPNLKFYGGGSDDVRGFLLRTLPKNDGLGALTKAAIKLEVRRTYLFKETLEGFFFLDAARFSDRSWSLERRTWYSPGIGLRWFSPIGMVQTYAARARATYPNEDFGNFYFIGMGGTF